MNKIFLVTALPGVLEMDFFKKYHNAISYNEWLSNEGVTSISDRSGRHVLLDLRSIFQQYKLMLSHDDIFLFSNHSWAEFESNNISTSFYIHLDATSYTIKETIFRNPLSDLMSRFPDLIKWNANIIRLAENKADRSLLLSKGEYTTLSRLEKQAEISSFQSAGSIDMLCAAINYSSNKSGDIKNVC